MRLGVGVCLAVGIRLGLGVAVGLVDMGSVKVML